MLTRLLERVRQGSVDVRRLAEELGTSEALVRQMLAELERLGYLKRPSRCGLTPCSRCPLQGGCVRLWYVREGKTGEHGHDQPLER